MRVIIRLRHVAAAAALAAAFVPSAASAQYQWEQDPDYEVQTAPRACSSITSFSPASARPGQQVDIYVEPGSGQTLAWSITGVEFANGVPASFARISQTQVRATVPLASRAGKLRVRCTTTSTGGTWAVESASDFTPVAFGNTLNPSSLNLIVGNSATITATLAGPAPEPVTLTVAPSSTAVAVNGLAAGASGTVTIPAGQQSVQFTVAARAAGSPSIAVSGHNVASSSLSVTIPQPWVSVSVPSSSAAVHWGSAASYSVELSSRNGFTGQVTLTATGLPFGASASPVTATVPHGGTTTAAFTVATAGSATQLGSDAFTLRAASPSVSAVTRTLDLRVLPDEGAFSGLSWQTADSNCNGFEADVTGSNITFDGPTFAQTQPHTLLRYAWTPSCANARGAVVIGTSCGINCGWPASIFNFGFAGAIADAPGSRFNIGSAAWAHNQFKVSPDGSFVIGVAQGTAFNANLYDLLSLSRRGATHSYSLAASLSARIVGADLQADASTGNDWVWQLP